MTTEKDKHEKRRRRRTQRGFSLTEILIALAIVSMIMGAAAWTFTGQLQKAKVKETYNQMRLVESALVQYQADTNENCPSALSELVQKRILKKEPKDGWEKPFTVKCPGEHGDIDLVSRGPDGKEGTEDDIRSWESPKEKK
jgi:general secretion pathway protein G